MSHPESAAARLRWQFPLLTLLLLLTLALLVYGLSVVVRGFVIYDGLHQPMEPRQTGRYLGQAYTSEPVLGLTLAPSADGAWLIARGNPVPFHHDDDGLRAPLGVRHAFQGQKHPRLLFLGDSFTYGQLVAAEDSFAYKTALKLGGESINAGAPGYGLAQMVLRARTLIPRYRPDYVVVQYSPWLVTRAQSEFSTDSSGLVMAPYFFDRGEGIGIALPTFTASPDVLARMAKYKTSPPSLSGRLAFLGEIAFPFFLHRDAGLVVFRARQWLHFQPGPSSRGDAIIRAAYTEIDASARENGARMIVLVLARAEQPEVPSELFPPDTAGVHGWVALVQRLAVKTPDEYGRHYFLWRGEPLQLVDLHPSEEAHEVIAEAVADRVRTLEQQHR